MQLQGAGRLAPPRPLELAQLEDRILLSASPLIWFSTTGDVGTSGAPGLSSWTAGQALQFGDPNLALEPPTTSGTLASAFNLDAFGGDTNIDSIHYVSRNLTVGGGGNTISLLQGDLLLSTAGSASLSSLNSLSVTGDEVFVFRPMMAGDYSSGTFSLLLDDFAAVHGGSDTRSLTLVEQATTVGNVTLSAGTFLFGRGDNNVRYFNPTGVGPGATSGTTGVLIEGDDLGIGPRISGLDVLETPTTIANRSFAAGTLLVALDANDSQVGSNSVAVTSHDIFTLTVSQTTLGSGTAIASAKVIFEGADVNLDAGAEAFDGLTLYYAANTPPSAIDDAYGVNEDATLNVVAAGVLTNDSDADSNPLTAVLVSGPTHGSLTLNADGSFDYTPVADFHGTDTFTYQATDGTANSNVATVTILVNPLNDAPVAVNDVYNAPPNLVVLGSLNVAGPGVLGNDIDAEGDPISAVLVSGPTNGSLTLNPDGSFIYTPNLLFFGTDTFTYYADDLLASSNTATVTINVGLVNAAPAATADAYATAEDNPLTVTAPGLLANDNDPDGDTVFAILVSGPSSGTLAFNSNGSFTYTPTANFNGTDSFTYRVSDGVLQSAPATVTITVNPVNDAPVASGEAYATSEDQALIVTPAGLLANDSDVDGGPLTAAVVSGPTHGALTLNSNGSFTYLPHLNFYGTDSFTYRASDGGLQSAAATVTISVSAANDAPVAANDAYAGNQDQAIQAVLPGLLANDGDAEGDVLTATVISGPAHGVLTLNADGSFTYVPNGGFVGTDSFSYRAGDGVAVSNVATVTLNVLQAAAPPDNGIFDIIFPPPNIGPSPWEDDGAPVEVSPPTETVNQGSTLFESPVAEEELAGDTADPRVSEAAVVASSETPLAEIVAVGLLPTDAPLAVDEGNAASVVVAGSEWVSLADRPRQAPQGHDTKPGSLPEAAREAGESVQFVSPDSALDELRSDMAAASEFQRIVVGGALAATTGLTVGYMLWMTRGGFLLSSLVAQLPAWRWVDPLVILDRLESGEVDGGESLQEIADNADAEPRAVRA